MEYAGAEGKLIHEKNQKQKILWHCPFKCTELATVLGQYRDVGKGGGTVR